MNGKFHTQSRKHLFICYLLLFSAFVYFYLLSVHIHIKSISLNLVFLKILCVLIRDAYLNGCVLNLEATVVCKEISLKHPLMTACKLLFRFSRRWFFELTLSVLCSS